MTINHKPFSYASHPRAFYDPPRLRSLATATCRGRRNIPRLRPIVAKLPAHPAHLVDAALSMSRHGLRSPAVTCACTRNLSRITLYSALAIIAALSTLFTGPSVMLLTWTATMSLGANLYVESGIKQSGKHCLIIPSAAPLWSYFVRSRCTTLHSLVTQFKRCFKDWFQYPIAPQKKLKAWRCTSLPFSNMTSSFALTSLF